MVSLLARSWIGPVLALSLVAVTCSPAPASKPAAPAPSKAEPEKVSFRLGFFLGGHRIPYVTALKKGYYQEENLDVDLREGEGGIANSQLVANGNLTIGESDAATTASLRDKGIDLKVIAAFGQKSSVGILAWKEAGITWPRDLVGKRLAVTPGEVPLVLLPAYLTNNGIDPSSVRQVPLDAANKFTAFLNRQVDTTTTYVTTLPPPYFAQQDQFSVFMYSDSGLAMLADCLLVSDETIKNRPDMLRRFLRATVRAFKECEADSAECANYGKQFKETADPELLAKQWAISVPLRRTDNTKDKPLGWMAEADWVATLDTLRSNGLLNTPTQPSDVYTNEFLPS